MRSLLLMVILTLTLTGCPTTGGPDAGSKGKAVCSKLSMTAYVEQACGLLALVTQNPTRDVALCVHSKRIAYSSAMIACITTGSIEPSF